MRPSTNILAVQLAFLLLAPRSTNADIHEHENDEGLFRFVSRPDIQAPKWIVNITQPDLVTSGYWFTAPFETLDQHGPGGSWIGPHIYDGNGDLVWSGSALSAHWGVEDFRISNVRGRDMLTYQIHSQGNGYILDETFQIQETVNLGTIGQDYNSHEFYFVEDGARAISIKENTRSLMSEEQARSVGWEGEGECRGIFNGFRVWDTETWKVVFEWDAAVHVGLNESTFIDGGVEFHCKSDLGWDYIHLNSVDVGQDGDFYVSARHTDTIYKVSKDDGHVIWRLHGYHHQPGDFHMGDVSFSRQHDVRFRGFNGTHELISILDNASGQDEQTHSHDFSRGLLIALQTDTQPMKATLVSAVDHPLGRGSYAPRRGNYQVLDSGNIFMGWSEQALHSEHTPDDKLIMSAQLQTQWLGTYRSYKFPFVGRPTESPVAVSAAYDSATRSATTMTMVHVSWNGATDVDSWNLYKTTASGERKILIFSKKKTGFETAMVWEGYASFVVVEAVDRDGNVLRETGVIETIAPPSIATSGAVADELFWLQEVAGENDDWRNERLDAQSRASVLILVVLGAVSTGLILAMLWIASLTGWMHSSGDLVRYRRYEVLEDSESGASEHEPRGKDFESSRESFHD